MSTHFSGFNYISQSGTQQANELNLPITEVNFL